MVLNYFAKSAHAVLALAAAGAAIATALIDEFFQGNEFTRFGFQVLFNFAPRYLTTAAMPHHFFFPNYIPR